MIQKATNSAGIGREEGCLDDLKLEKMNPENRRDRELVNEVYLQHQGRIDQLEIGDERFAVMRRMAELLLFMKQGRTSSS